MDRKLISIFKERHELFKHSTWKMKASSGPALDAIFFFFFDMDLHISISHQHIHSTLLHPSKVENRNKNRSYMWFTGVNWP